MNETEPYFYVKNLMGDICEIVDKNGETVAAYQYDAWGNVLKSEGDPTILQLNPFTYRGYIYDSETGFYYLQTRYYNPEWNRFINADTNLDTQTSIVGTNVFAYCYNSPISKLDFTGRSSNVPLTFVEFIKVLSYVIKFDEHSKGVINGEIYEIDFSYKKFEIDPAFAADLAIMGFWAIAYIGAIIAQAVAELTIMVGAAIVGVVGAVLTGLTQLNKVTQIDIKKIISDSFKNSFILSMAFPNPFDHVTPGDYVLGFLSIVVSPNGNFLPYTTHNYFFIFGPEGTSLEFSIYFPWKGAIKI